MNLKILHRGRCCNASCRCLCYMCSWTAGSSHEADIIVALVAGERPAYATMLHYAMLCSNPALSGRRADSVGGIG